jgi:hypothetical protein
VKKKAILLAILIAIVVAAANFLFYSAGRQTGLAFSANPAAMAESFQNEKATFCDLHEDARLYACPAMRKAIPLPSGVALVYVCDINGQTGFVSFIQTTPEVKTAAIGKLLETGMRVGPHCTTKAEEILWLKMSQGKTAAW